MDHELDKYRISYSLKEALQELNLSIREFSDLITENNIPAWIICPPEKCTRLFYDDAKFSFDPGQFIVSDSSFEVSFLAIDNLSFKTIALGGKKIITRFESIILNTSERISPSSIHESIRDQLLLLTNSTAPNLRALKKQPKYFYKKYVGVNSHKKWIGLVTKPKSSDAAPWQIPEWLHSSRYLATLGEFAVSSEAQTDNVENPYPGSLDHFFWPMISGSQNYTPNAVEKLWVEKRDILFISSDIHDLQKILKTRPPVTPPRTSTNRLDILNDCFKNLANDISSIADPDRYWKDHEETSIIAQHIAARMNLKAINTIEYYTKALISDSTLFRDEKIELPLNVKYPEHFPQALIILNFVRESHVKISTKKEQKEESTRIKAALVTLGFKPRAALNLKSLINNHGKI